MLTQEQADDLNLQLHKQEAAEIGLDRINQDLDKYTDMIRRVADMMKTATPEQKERIRSIAPRLLEEYNNLKLKKSTYEDSYREATSKINEYNTLNAQQPQVTNQTKRRTINTNGIDTTGWTTLPDGTKISPDGRTTVSPNGQVAMGVGIEQTLPYSNGVNAMMGPNNGWIRQSDGTMISSDGKSIMTTDGNTYPLLTDTEGNRYYQGINSKIYPSFGHGGVITNADGTKIYPSEAHGGTQETVTPIKTPTFTPIQNPLDRYGYHSNLFTPRYQGTYRYTNPTTISGRRNSTMGNGGNGR